MAVDSVVTSTSTDSYGNAYTDSVSNDELTNEDFLTLMLEGMKQQDPTNPSDTDSIMQSQMQMSTIQANQDMSEAMTALQSSYSNSALSTAANLIGTSVKTGETDESGEEKVFKVFTVDNVDNELSVTVREFTGFTDGLLFADETVARYDTNGKIYDAAGNETDYNVSLDGDGRFNFDSDGNVELLDDSYNVITDASTIAMFTYGGYTLDYSDESIQLPIESITAIS